MPPHPLDNPLWSSLSTLHRDVALGGADLLRYPADVAPFLAVPRDGAAVSPEAVGALVRAGETVFCIGPAPAAPPGWRVDELGEILQLVCEGAVADPGGPEVVALGERERDAVLELTALVYPHYFRPRTPELGRYFGIVEHGRLTAMIGERMGMPGLRELSAVCTHPEATGRGLARHLLAFLVGDLRVRGTTPFLHVSPTNDRARRLYEQNGFRARRSLAFRALHRPAEPAA